MRLCETRGKRLRSRPGPFPVLGHRVTRSLSGLKGNVLSPLFNLLPACWCVCVSGRNPQSCPVCHRPNVRCPFVSVPGAAASGSRARASAAELRDGAGAAPPRTRHRSSFEKRSSLNSTSIFPGCCRSCCSCSDMFSIYMFRSLIRHQCRSSRCLLLAVKLC